MKRKQYELIISPEAEEELNISKEFYEQRQEGLGSELVKEAENTLNRIVANPKQFPKVKNKQVRKAIVKRFPYGIFFALKEPIINVLSIWNFSRSPKRLNKRLKK
jgi:hypothetical protein